MVNCQLVVASFSPHNGEVILKAKEMSDLLIELHEFQSPQWGSNSKDNWYSDNEERLETEDVSVPAMGR